MIGPTQTRVRTHSLALTHQFSSDPFGSQCLSASNSLALSFYVSPASLPFGYVALRSSPPLALSACLQPRLSRSETRVRVKGGGEG
eukprot:61001-Pleurochrysis_carterae.AAC.1